MHANSWQSCSKGIARSSCITTKEKGNFDRIVTKLNEKDKQILVNVVANHKSKRKSVTTQQTNDIRKFFARDDISRVSSKSRDVKKYKCPDTGDEVLFPTRHMIMAIKDAYALFVEERRKENLGKRDSHC